MFFGLNKTVHLYVEETSFVNLKVYTSKEEKRNVTEKKLECNMKFGRKHTHLCMYVCVYVCMCIYLSFTIYIYGWIGIDILFDIASGCISVIAIQY